MSATPIPPHSRVLAIDPGSRMVGYAVVSKSVQSQSTNSYLVHKFGTLKINPKKSFPERLFEIHTLITELIVTHQPTQFVLEKVFFAKDATAALKLGQARGVILLAGMQAALPVFEYSPNEIKSAVVGHGHATKEQVAKMVSLILRIKEFPSSDASDALAIAICHLNSYTYQNRVQQAQRLAGQEPNP